MGRDSDGNIVLIDEFQRGLQEGMSIAGEDMDRGGMTKEHLDESE